MAATGVTESDLLDHALEPTPLTACTWKKYAVPFVRPVTVCVVAADAAFWNVVQVTPSVPYCTT